MPRGASNDPSVHSEGHVDLPSASILVVDDDTIMRRALRRDLTFAGFLVVEAADGREAADLVLDRHFDVILSDVGMPALGASSFFASCASTTSTCRWSF